MLEENRLMRYKSSSVFISQKGERKKEREVILSQLA